MALGAKRSSGYKLVMREVGWLTAASLAFGLVCSLAVSISIRTTIRCAGLGRDHSGLSGRGFSPLPLDGFRCRSMTGEV